MTREESVGMWDDFEFFEKKGGKFGDPKITITRDGTFLFNVGFCHKANLEDKNAVILGYHPKKKAIIFQFTEDPKAKSAFTLIHRGSAGSTTCRSFFSAYEFDKTKITGRYHPYKERMPRVGDVWLIKLDERSELRK